MAAAQVWVRFLALVLAGFLGLVGPAVGPARGQAPIVVNERPIPPSSTGELGEADIARAVAMIRDLGNMFGTLAARRDGTGAGAAWSLYRDTYHRAADRIDDLRDAGHIAVGDLADGRAATLAEGGMVLDSTLGGGWQPDQVRKDRRLGGGDWAAISRLAGVLIEQLMASDQTTHEEMSDWAAWATAHDPTARLQDLAGEAPGPQLRPLLLRFWHIQDKYVANALSAAARSVGQLGRAAALSNEMLGVLRQAEDVAGWRWRKPLETVWSESVERTSALAGTLAPPPSAAVAGPVDGTDTQQPRSADFDELFTATDPDVDEIRADVEVLRGAAGALRADVDALGGDAKSLRTDVQGLRGDTDQLRGHVDVLGGESKSLRADAEGLREGADQLRGHVDALDGDTQSLRTDVDSLRGDAEQLRGHVDALGGESKSLRADVNNLRDETGGLRSTVDTLSGETTSLRGTVQSLGRDTKSAQAELEGLHSDTGSLRANIETLSGETAALRAGAQILGGESKSLRTDVDTLSTETKSLRAQVAALDADNAARTQVLQSLEAELRQQSQQVETLSARIAEHGRSLGALANDTESIRLVPAALADLTARQAALEKRAAALGREVGPEGLPQQLAELRAALGSEQGRSRDAEQRLEARVQDRLRALGREIESTRQQVKYLQSGLSVARPSHTAVEVPLRDEVARRTAFHQAVLAGVVLLGLLVAAIVFWVRAARERATAVAVDQDGWDQDGPEHEELGISAEAPGTAPEPAEDTALSDELARLRGAVGAERNRAGAMAERLAGVSASLAESQARGRRLEAELAAVRTATRTMGRGLLDGAERDRAMEAELAQLRQAVDAERERSAALQARFDEIKASVAPPAGTATPALNGASPHDAGGPAPEDQPTPSHHSAPGGVPGDFVANHALRHRAIEALHRGDLAGFELAFAELTALPLAMIEDMVREPSGHDLALACRAAEIAKAHFAAILILNRRSRSGGTHQDPRQLAQALALFDETSDEDASKALHAWQAHAPSREGWANRLS